MGDGLRPWHPRCSVRVRVPDDRGKPDLAAGDRAADQVRAEVGRHRLDLGELGHPYATTVVSLRMSAQFWPAFASTSSPVARS